MTPFFHKSGILFVSMKRFIIWVRIKAVTGKESFKNLVLILSIPSEFEFFKDLMVFITSAIETGKILNSGCEFTVLKRFSVLIYSFFNFEGTSS